MPTEVEELKAELKRLNAMITEISGISTGGITEATNAVAGQVLGLRRFYEDNRAAIEREKIRSEFLQKDLSLANGKIKSLINKEIDDAKRIANIKMLLKSANAIISAIRKELT